MILRHVEVVVNVYHLGELTFLILELVGGLAEHVGLLLDCAVLLARSLLATLTVGENDLLGGAEGTSLLPSK
jgi:hypothetical protein